MYLSISICIIKIHPLLKVQREITTWRILCLKILLWQQTFALFPASPPSSAKSSCLRSTIIVIFIVDKLFDCPTTLTSLPVIWRDEGGRGTKEQAGGGREVPKDDEDDNWGERGRERERKTRLLLILHTLWNKVSISHKLRILAQLGDGTGKELVRRRRGRGGIKLCNYLRPLEESLQKELFR